VSVLRVTPILNVSDVGASIEWFEQFGWRRGFTWNEGGSIAGAAAANANGPAGFGSVCTDDTEMFLCLDGQGERGTWVSWWVRNVAEVDAIHERALQVGAEITYPPTDEPWGIREFHLRHPDGHTFRVSAGLHAE
jgi:uncharacterized glyoxalase superfamily protein PhnB